jgi:hypothetical protein
MAVLARAYRVQRTAPTKTSTGLRRCVHAGEVVTSYCPLSPHPIHRSRYVIYFPRSSVRGLLRQNGWPRTARFRGSSLDPRGSAIQSLIQRSICCRTQRPPRDGTYSTLHTSARRRARLYMEEGIHSCSSSSENQRQTTPMLSLHHPRLSARTGWSGCQRGPGARVGHSLRDTERTCSSDPAAELGRELLSPSPGEERARVPDPQSTRCAATAFVPCQFVAG